MSCLNKYDMDFSTKLASKGSMHFFIIFKIYEAPNRLWGEEGKVSFYYGG